MENNNFEAVKAALPIESLVGHYGGENKKHWNPSPCCGHKDCCRIYDEGRKWKCYSCDLGGSVIDLIMVVDGLDKVEALKKGAQIAGIELKGVGEAGSKAEVKESVQERMYRLTAGYYERLMEGSKEGHKWFIKERGHKAETLKKMRVGWADGKLLAWLRKEGFTAADVVANGLASDRDSKGEAVKRPYDYFNKGVAIFPVIDHAGKVISFTCKDPTKKRKASLMRGEGKKWFLNHAALGRHRELIVVEGENDVASLIDAGMDNVVGTAGGPSKDQLRLLKNHLSGKTVYLWFDKDAGRDWRKNEGGPGHTRKVYEALEDSGIEVRIITHPGEENDPDDYVRGLEK